MAARAWHGDGAEPSRDDLALVSALRDGHEDAFQALVSRYHETLVRLAMTFVHDRDVAEEVAQDAWIAMLEGLHRFEGRSSFKTWLFGILVNTARACHRRESHLVPFSTLDGDDSHAGPSVEPDRFHPEGHRWAGHWADPPQAWPEEHALELETAECLQEALDALPPVQRAVVALRDIQGWTAREVCDVLHITEGNQRVLLHRARSRIRQALEDHLGTTNEVRP